MSLESPSSSTTKGDCTNEVEWQIAFFWMICIALNAMTQPPGRVCGFNSKHGFLLRSSPVICAFDAVDVIAAWMNHVLWHGDGLTSAAKSIAQTRFRDKDDENQAGEELLIEALEKNTTVRRVVFVLGTLPQAVKLFASYGTSWLKVWAGMYLGSWISVELLIWLNTVHDESAGPRYCMIARSELVNDTHLSNRIRTFWIASAILAHIVLMTAIAIPKDENPIWLVVGGLFIWLEIFEYSVLETSLIDSETLGALNSFGSMLFVGMTSAFILGQSQGTGKPVEHWVFIGWCFGGFLLRILVISGVLRFSDKVVIRSRYLGGGVDLGFSSCVALVTNLYVLYVYFSWNYVSKDTVLPKWTHWLG